jgi:hypothetical protein
VAKKAPQKPRPPTNGFQSKKSDNCARDQEQESRNPPGIPLLWWLVVGRCPDRFNLYTTSAYSLTARPKKSPRFTIVLCFPLSFTYTRTAAVPSLPLHCPSLQRSCPSVTLSSISFTLRLPCFPSSSCHLTPHYYHETSESNLHFYTLLTPRLSFSSSSSSLLATATPSSSSPTSSRSQHPHPLSP